VIYKLITCALWPVNPGENTAPYLAITIQTDWSICF